MCCGVHYIRKLKWHRHDMSYGWYSQFVNLPSIHPIHPSILVQPMPIEHGNRTVHSTHHDVWKRKNAICSFASIKNCWTDPQKKLAVTSSSKIAVGFFAAIAQLLDFLAFWKLHTSQATTSNLKSRNVDDINTLHKMNIMLYMLKIKCTADAVWK